MLPHNPHLKFHLPEDVEYESIAMFHAPGMERHIVKRKTYRSISQIMNRVDRTLKTQTAAGLNHCFDRGATPVA